MLPYKDTRTSHNPPLQTIVLIALTVIVFILQISSANPESFIRSFALIPARIDLSDYSTLTPFFSAMFLHGGFFHIISNMLFLWVFGDNIEERFGIWYVPFYILGGIAANFGQYLLMPDSPIPIVGASGAIAAVLGAYLIFFPRHTIKTFIFILFFVTIVSLPAYVLLVYWFLLQLFSGLTSYGSLGIDSGGVAYFAHITGFVFGVLVALLAWRNGGDRKSYAW